MVELDTLLPLVRKPSRYLGNEFNVVKKEWDQAGLRLALVFPDLYEIGMSHHGLQILYRIINSRADLLAERVYAPDTDMEELLRRRRVPLFSLESRRPLARFDLIGITLPYELCYTNILTILDLARIPFRAQDRDGSHPLILGGGSGSLNPEPVAEFFDAILLGDGEEAIIEIADIMLAAKKQGSPRPEVLQRLAGVAGVYIPAFFKPVHDRTGKLLEIRPLRPGYERVRRRVLADLGLSAGPNRPLVPQARIVHDRLGVELARGCTRGCRFCQAGIIYRPVRERPVAMVEEMARAGIEASGFDELALLSLSSGDYACLPQLLGRLMDFFAREYVSVSMPSMRVGTLTEEIMAQIKRVRKTGFTVAPEAGTDRLRRVLNKGITEQDLLDTCRAAFDQGWQLIKFYFMFGLPTETEEDVAAIAELARRALKTAGRPARINISVATFVPKPHTPFQWEPQLTVEQGFARIDLLKKLLPRKGFRLKWHDPRQSFLEGVFSRGDRRLSRVIEAAWQRGTRLDGWSEYFRLDTWLDAGRACGIELEQYLRRRHLNEVLPWQHLDPGVDPEFLVDELARAHGEEYTPDCRFHGCQQCGVCDFKTVRPVVFTRTEAETETPARSIALSRPRRSGPAGDAAHLYYRFTYSRLGDARFLAHLELLREFFQAFRRAGLGINFSQGFNPSPRVSFSPALPLGSESMVEYLDADLTGPVRETATLMARLNHQLPAGITITAIVPSPAGNKRTPPEISVGYRVDLPAGTLTPARQEQLAEFLARESFRLARIRKGRRQQVDVRPLVEEFTRTGRDTLELVLRSVQGRPGVKPLELLGAVLGLAESERAAARVIKLWWGEPDPQKGQAITRGI
ncbi:MAG: TIGR03960 family B12-binding radical SAM protein [Desulfobacterales bacterium]|nr:TIGR03960 family B12-binding radical SAM protein [Desulfobacterales bacterium]